MKKRLIQITLTMICAANLLTGCDERPEETESEEIQITETKIPREDGLMPENNLDEADESAQAEQMQEEEESRVEPQEEQAQEEEPSRVEPTGEHDRQMLALLDESCGSQIYVYASVDMDKDGENEMIGVTDNDFSVWYCSSDLEDCYMVSDGPSHGYDDCSIKEIEFDGERHVVINTYNLMGNDKSYSILALHDGKMEILVDDNYGYVYENEKNDIILDVESYDGEYDKDGGFWLMHTWVDTYLYYEDGKYGEYGAAKLSESDFLKFDNAREVLDEIDRENRNEDVLEMRYSYFLRKNGIVHIQCEEESEWFIDCYYYTFRVNGNRLDTEMSQNYGNMYPVLSQLDEVTYP